MGILNIAPAERAGAHSVVCTPACLPSRSVCRWARKRHPRALRARHAAAAPRSPYCRDLNPAQYRSDRAFAGPPSRRFGTEDENAAAILGRIGSFLSFRYYYIFRCSRITLQSRKLAISIIYCRGTIHVSARDLRISQHFRSWCDSFHATADSTGPDDPPIGRSRST
jgi:hypothetical protein